MDEWFPRKIKSKVTHATCLGIVQNDGRVPFLKLPVGLRKERKPDGHSEQCKLQAVVGSMEIEIGKSLSAMAFSNFLTGNRRSKSLMLVIISFEIEDFRTNRNESLIF
ncbi:MAG: hypothetical protein IPN29_01780 [Saprospiraceae bacterium]|nr:hypothetical protein [Saprospiraceae bacterium]